MKNLFFVRSKTETHSWEYFDSKTEAIVLGDREGYAYLISCMSKAKTGKTHVYLNEIDASSYSMRVVICPAAKNDFPEMLRIIERPVYLNGSPNMELVICGNIAGYVRIITMFSAVLQSSSDGFDNHIHLDDVSDVCLVPRSVSLNIRSPLDYWSKELAGIWSDKIYCRQADFMPTGIEYLFSNPEHYIKPNSKIILKSIRKIP